MAFSFMSWFNRVSMPVADDQLMAEFCFTPTQIGWISSALLFAYALCMTPGGWFIDRFGPWAALVAMGFGSALFGTLTALGGSGVSAAGLAFSSFLVIRAWMGVFTAPIYPASARIVSRWVTFPQRAWANGLITGAAPLGIACAHVVFGALIDSYGWRMAFVITGTCTGLLALLWAGYATDYPGQHRSTNAAERQLIWSSGPQTHMPEKKDAVDPPARASWWLLLRNRSLVLLTLSYAAVGYFEYLFFFWTEYYFKGVLHLPVEQSRWYATVASLAMVVTMPLGGWLSDRLVRHFGYRLGRALVPAGGMVGGAFTLYAATYTTTPEWVLAWFILAHGAIGATEGSFWATAIDLGGRRGGTSAGICNTGGNAGGLVAPVATPWIGTHLSWTWSLNLSCLICLLGAGLWLWIDPNQRADETA
jgi:MFS family permease